MAEEFASDFVLDPNRNNGYPAVDSIPDADFGTYYIPPFVRSFEYCDLDIYSGVLDGYPSYNVNVPWMPYTIPDSSVSNAFMYMETNLDIYNGVLEGYPSYNEEVYWMPYTIPDKSISNAFMYMETDFVLNMNYLEGYPSYDEEVYWRPLSFPGYEYGDMYFITDLESHEGVMQEYFIHDNTDEWKMFGAFSNSTVSRVNIPSSVKNIDNWAFYNCPNLERVKIARDCLYYENSFPPGCVIEYHNDD